MLQTRKKHLLFFLAAAKWLLLGLLAGNLGVSLAAQEGRSFQLPQDAGLIIRLKNLEEAQAPFISHNLLFFTYKGTPNTQVVGIAFESEAFAKLKMLERNAHDVFIYAIPIAAGNRVAYRYWVDGLWHRDPANPNYYLDSYEVAISLFENKDTSLLRRNNPVVVGRDYDFYAQFDPGDHVYILGNFNNWNPFISPLEEIEPGVYYIRIQHLQPG
ncbi:MAG: hypothetical protein AAF975_08160, partial [Spirochaetota bacterium]